MDREAHRDRGAFAWGALNIETAAEFTKSISHETETVAGRPGLRPLLPGRNIESLTVIHDVEPDATVGVDKGHHDARCVRVKADVGKCGLGTAQ